MGLNFGAFAGGLAVGIDKGFNRLEKRKKERREEELRLAQISLSNKKLKDKLEIDASSKIQSFTEAVAEYKEKFDTAETSQEKNAINNQIRLIQNSFGTVMGTYASQGSETANAFMSNPNPLFSKSKYVDYTVNDYSYILTEEERNELNKIKNPNMISQSDSGDLIVYGEDESGNMDKNNIAYRVSPSTKKDKDETKHTKGTAVQRAVELRNKSNLTKEEATELKTIEEAYDIESSKQTKTTLSDVKLAGFNAYNEKLKDQGKPEVSYEEYENTMKSVPALKAVSDVRKYGRQMSEDNYDWKQASTLEDAYRNSDAYKNNKTLQDDEKLFVEYSRTHEGMKGLEVRFEDAVNGGLYKSGFIDTNIKKIAQYLDNNDVESLTGLSVDELSTAIGIDTSAGDTVARYVKLISGAAATDAERQTLTNIMFGSEYKSETARLTAFKQFVNDRKKEVSRIGKDIKEKLPYTYGERTFKKKNKKEDNEFGLSVDEFIGGL
jgi:hypothetical protein